MPRISVLLPVRNAAPWLPASVASLSRQTFRDFEIVAVDDGSTDGSPRVLESLAAREPRLRVIRTPHRGLPRALTTALARAHGPWIARHDADDLSHRDRLRLQYEFLKRHRGISAVGTRLKLFPAAAAGPGMRRWARWHNTLLTHDEMAREALIDSPLAHGTALFRRAALEAAGGWIERGWPEDVDLWLRLLGRGARIAKLPRVLYAWRQHPESATRRDPRYAPARYAELRHAALRTGILRGARAVTLVAVGATLERWSARLREGHDLRPLALGRPGPGTPSLEAPIVLAFGAAPARARWRGHLERTGLREARDFVFVG